jgi:hypothetical protein
VQRNARAGSIPAGEESAASHVHAGLDFAGLDLAGLCAALDALAPAEEPVVAVRVDGRFRDLRLLDLHVQRHRHRKNENRRRGERRIPAIALRAAGKPPKAVRIALARKLLVRLNAKARDVRKQLAQTA